MAEVSWQDMKKRRITSFKDKTGKICWSFYYKDLRKLFKMKKMNKSTAKMIMSIFRDTDHYKKNYSQFHGKVMK